MSKDSGFPEKRAVTFFKGHLGVDILDGLEHNEILVSQAGIPEETPYASDGIGISPQLDKYWEEEMNMTTKKRRQSSPEQKMAILRGYLLEQVAVSDLCQSHEERFHFTVNHYTRAGNRA